MNDNIYHWLVWLFKNILVILLKLSWNLLATEQANNLREHYLR